MWPFTRKPKSIDPGRINEDWRPGDLAECIRRDGKWWRGADGPAFGDVLKVTGIGVAHFDCNDGRSGWFLTFRHWPRGFDAREFRKVPVSEIEASAEFTAQIKALRPAKKRRTAKSS